MCLFQLIADPLEAQVAGSTIAFDVGHTREFIAVFHVTLVNAIRRAQEHAAVLTVRGHLF